MAPVLYGETKETFCGKMTRGDRMEGQAHRVGFAGGQAGVWHLPRAANFKCGAGRYAISGFENPDRHRDHPSMDKPYDRTVHEVNILPDTPLAALYGPGPLAVNMPPSSGHQGLAPALLPRRWLPDGLIEAVYLPEYRFVQAVRVAPGTSLAGGGKPKFAAQFCGRLPGIIK